MLPLYFFLPGYNASLVFFPRLLRSLERAILAFSSSFIIMGLVAYAVSIGMHMDIARSSYAALVGVSAAGLIAGTFGARRSAPEKKEDYRALWASLVIFGLALAAIFALYPYIPESDPYLYMGLASTAIAQNAGASTFALRPLFSVLTVGLSTTGDISLYNLFKYLLPALGAVMVLPVYAQAAASTQNKFARLALALLPATVPVIMLEDVVSRPQLMLMVAFPGIIYLLGRSLRYRSAWLAGYLLVLSLILLRFHELSVILILISFVTLCVLLWSEAKKAPKLAAAMALLVLLALYPHLGFLTAFQGFYLILLERLSPFQPRLWFLSGYTNIDGDQVGWPGLSWILYYGYNLGLAVPFIGLYMAGRRFKLRRPTLESLPALLSVGIFFSIAEILPRLNMPYLPDRAWSFMLLSFCLLIPGALAGRGLAAKLTRGAKAFIVVLVAVSTGCGLAVAYAKQGSTTPNEHQAALFLKSSTPSNAIFITQGGNSQMVEYYGGRKEVAMNIFTLGLSSQQAADQLKGLEARQVENRDAIAAQKRGFIDQLNQSFHLDYDASPEAIEAYRDARATVFSQLAAANVQLAAANDDPYASHPPIYVLYSQDKFNFLYGKRLWWQNLNYAGADLSIFADARYFTPVYAAGNVYVWRLKY